MTSFGEWMDIVLDAATARGIELAADDRYFEAFIEGATVEEALAL